MAIIIPSKYISSIKNPKVRDNYIDNVEVNYTVISSDDKIEEVVHNETYKSNEVLFAINDHQKGSIDIDTYQDFATAIYTVASLLEGQQVWANISIKIPKNSKNSWISKIFKGVRSNDNGVNTSWIGVNIKYKKTEYDASAFVSGVGYDKGNWNGEYTISETQLSNPRTELAYADRIPFCRKNLSISSAYEHRGNTAISTIDLPNRDNILDERIFSDTDKDYVFSNIKILTKSKEIPLSLNTYDVRLREFTISGTAVEYVAEEVTLTFYGNTIGIDLKDGTVTVGSGDLPFSTTSNELIHTGATTYGENITSYIGDNILNQYRDGKETCTVKCTISDYYTESGELAISPHKGEVPMTFSIGDEVIPMVYTVDKTDRAISKYNNGMDKVFVVVGVKPSYTGACWQELTLLEKTE